MKKYFGIGAIVGLLISVERLGRIPGAYSEEDIGDWRFWIGAIIGWLINAVVWPLTIVYEIADIINGR